MKKPAPKTAAKTTAKTDTPDGERIAKYLSRAGVASRREAERMIETGQVAVNGKVIDSPALNITAKDKITIDGRPVAPPEAARLWLYYKPEGLVTSASDEKGRDTVFDNLPEDLPRVMSIGRLDLNSEGLLLLTNDGGLKRRLELPSTGWLRKYRVRVKGNPTDADLEPLRRGITVEGERFQPMELAMDRHQGANAWLTVGLREGKNREIRRAMNEIGLTVNRLIRISYGPFRLNEMQPGDVEEVRPKVLRDQLGLSAEADDDAPARRVTRVTTSRKADDVAPRRSVPTGAARKPKGDAPRWLDEEMTTKRPARRTDGDSPRGRSATEDRPARPARAGAGASDKPAPRRTVAVDRTGDGPAPRRFGTSAAKRGDEDAPRPTRAGGKPAGAARREDGDRPKSPARSTGKSAYGDRAAEGKPAAKDRPAAARSAGPKTGGAAFGGAKPAGGKSFGARSAGKPAGERSGASRPTGGKPSGKPRPPRKD
ncbi:MAG: RNA pseudouridine synthase [Rhodobacteraceae bacterium PARR1]|nr:MAG: RNA pseudouridine synthase [Rhodobacteraceae bacterium PARR1]